MELRQAGVSDGRVLNALEQVPRDVFVDAGQAARAYANQALPIPCGQTISQPLVVGLMTQALQVTDRCKVLEIGTGSGYQAAVLAKLARRVYSLERHRDLQQLAEGRFRQLGLYNVHTRLGDGWKGWPEQALFDRIIVTAAADHLPETLLEQLAPGGIMVIPVGRQYGDQHLMWIHKTEEEHVEEQRLFPVRFVPMLHGLAPSAR